MVHIIAKAKIIEKCNPGFCPGKDTHVAIGETWEIKRLGQLF